MVLAKTSFVGDGLTILSTIYSQSSLIDS